MFNLFKKDPIKTLEKKKFALLEKARDIQRSGDLRTYAKIIAESEAIQQEIDKQIIEKHKNS